MSRKKNLVFSSILALCVMTLDRMTKLYALHNFIVPYALTNTIMFELVFNRGISWGMLTFESPHLFFMISCLIATVIFILFLYTRTRFLQGHTIFGETLVLAGAMSNLADRFIYDGVIDFIVLSYASWVFPVFNVADVCIMIGIMSMYLHMAHEPS